MQGREGRHEVDSGPSQSSLCPFGDRIRGLLIGTVIARPQNDEYIALNMGWRRGGMGRHFNLLE